MLKGAQIFTASDLFHLILALSRNAQGNARWQHFKHGTGKIQAGLGNQPHIEPALHPP